MIVFFKDFSNYKFFSFSDHSRIQMGASTLRNETKNSEAKSLPKTVLRRYKLIKILGWEILRKNSRTLKSPQKITKFLGRKYNQKNSAAEILLRQFSKHSRMKNPTGKS